MVERFIINYDGRGEQVHPSGDFVHYSSYAELEAENARLKKALSEQIDGYIVGVFPGGSYTGSPPVNGGTIYDHPRNVPQGAVGRITFGSSTDTDLSCTGAVQVLPRPDAVSMTCGTICLEYEDRDRRDAAYDWLENHAYAPLSALEPAAPDVIAKGLLSDADAKAAKLGKFGHHPDPAIDFEIEVESLQARLIDAKGGISKPGTEPEAPAAVLADIERAMTFRVGGDPSAVRAKQMLRDLEADAKQAVQPAAPEGKQPVAEAAIMSAILDCPHEIDAQSIILRRSSIAEGHNALNQLHRRLTVALKAAMEAGRHG